MDKVTRAKEKRTKQLGMNPATASGALKKQLMFHLAQKCEMDTCYQCGKRIETSKELSVEHKTPWMDSEDPVGLFFDLDNIAFSHLSCNVSATRTRGPARYGEHGGSAMYQRGCRCQPCKDGKAEVARRHREKFKQ
jgi:hypothetical protein